LKKWGILHKFGGIFHEKILLLFFKNVPEISMEIIL